MPIPEYNTLVSDLLRNEAQWSPTLNSITGLDDDRRRQLLGVVVNRRDVQTSVRRLLRSSLVDDQGLVYRYLSDDGLEGSEGAFVICTFWLAHAHATAGHVDRAREVFARAIELRNDLDLLAEERLGDQMLGNFPQAFSHIGLVNAAWAISQAGSAASSST